MLEFWFSKYFVELIMSCGIGFILLLVYFISGIINIIYKRKFDKKLKDKEHQNKR